MGERPSKPIAASWWMTALRWTAFAPAGWLAMALFNILNRAVLQNFCCVGMISRRWGETVDAGFIAWIDGMIFVLIGAAVAPSHRRTVAIVLASVTSTLCAILAAGTLYAGEWPAAIPFATFIIGCVAAAACAREGMDPE